MAKPQQSEKLPVKTAQIVYRLVRGAISTHKALLEKLYDDVVWDDPVPTKEGGVLACETLIGRKGISPKRASAIRSDLEYWAENYQTLRKDVFYRHNPSENSLRSQTVPAR